MASITSRLNLFLNDNFYPENDNKAKGFILALRRVLNILNSEMTGIQSVKQMLRESYMLGSISSDTEAKSKSTSNVVLGYKVKASPASWNVYSVNLGNSQEEDQLTLVSEDQFKEMFSLVTDAINSLEYEGITAEFSGGDLCTIDVRGCKLVFRQTNGTGASEKHPIYYRRGSEVCVSTNINKGFSPTQSTNLEESLIAAGVAMEGFSFEALSSDKDASTRLSDWISSNTDLAELTSSETSLTGFLAKWKKAISVSITAIKNRVPEFYNEIGINVDWSSYTPLHSKLKNSGYLSTLSDILFSSSAYGMSVERDIVNPSDIYFVKTSFIPKITDAFTKVKQGFRSVIEIDNLRIDLSEVANSNIARFTELNEALIKAGLLIGVSLKKPSNTAKVSLSTSDKEFMSAAARITLEGSLKNVAWRINLKDLSKSTIRNVSYSYHSGSNSYSTLAMLVNNEDLHLRSSLDEDTARIELKIRSSDGPSGSTSINVSNPLEKAQLGRATSFFRDYCMEELAKYTKLEGKTTEKDFIKYEINLHHIPVSNFKEQQSFERCFNSSVSDANKNILVFKRVYREAYKTNYDYLISNDRVDISELFRKSSKEVVIKEPEIPAEVSLNKKGEPASNPAFASDSQMYVFLTSLKNAESPEQRLLDLTKILARAMKYKIIIESDSERDKEDAKEFNSQVVTYFKVS